MMTKLMISGWNLGFQKVQFTRLMKQELGLTLQPAKQITDNIMDGEPVELRLPDDQAEHLLAAMQDLGAICAAAVTHINA